MCENSPHGEHSMLELLDELIAANRLESFANIAEPLCRGLLPSYRGGGIDQLVVKTTLACFHGLDLLMAGINLKGSLLEVPAQLLTPVINFCAQTWVWFDCMAVAGSGQHSQVHNLPDSLRVTAVAGLEKLSTVKLARLITQAGAVSALHSRYHLTYSWTTAFNDQVLTRRRSSHSVCLVLSCGSRHSQQEPTTVPAAVQAYTRP